GGRRWRHRASGRTPVLPDGLWAPDEGSVPQGAPGYRIAAPTHGRLYRRGRAEILTGDFLMRITQGCFSFLPDLTDDQILTQVQYCLDNGWAVNLEFTDDPIPATPIGRCGDFRCSTCATPRAS